MKKIILATVAALTLSTPAFAADFSGARIGGNIGFADDDFAGTEAFVYGVNVGYDADLGNLVVGGTLEYAGSDEDGLERDLSAVARIGGKAGENALVYALGGYTNVGIEGIEEELDGVRLGAGVEFALTPQVFANGEYRYSNYEAGYETHQMLVGVGFRF